ncbi:MAG TPA: hypothetical protein VF176_00585 [Solirubrobacterales bacterium]
MIATYAAVLAVCAASLALGQAAVALCGGRRWSWLAPAVGLALLCAVCWATVRMPGEGVLSAVAVLALVIASVGFLRGRVDGGGEALRIGFPVGFIALAAASLPFIVEGHFGILGTGFNPDMSQHLLAVDRLADGAGSQLLHQGYPLGPHAIVVALNKGLGIGLVQGFGGLTVAVAVLAPLTALAAFAELSSPRRIGGALVVGLAYMVASYFAQGAFKETMQALFVLAFVLALRESTKEVWAGQLLRLVPAALIAVGSVYAYSFPGLIWLVGALALWLALERSLPVRPMLLALVVFGVLALPELGRMIDFHSFETFDPAGPGLGNLFGQVSPFEALGIWPSGDFRLAPGDGAVPAVVYYLGAAFAALLLIHGLVWCLRRRESAILAGLFAVAAVYALTRLAGTPYTAAKSIVVAAPIAALIILLPLLRASDWRLIRPYREKVANSRRKSAYASLAAACYVLAAGGCSLLAFANAPVGPTAYTPALTELRPLIASGATLVLASDALLDDQHGARYIVWELRGGRVCVGSEAAAGARLPRGIRFVVTEGVPHRPPYGALRVRRVDAPYVLWERIGPLRGHSDCPLIAVRQARQGS